ncbi:MAG: metallophosphoesterase [Fibrobacteraceae bacterium]|nr:metallophosphoesterase [Fibrobacteraceae bacterium]
MSRTLYIGDIHGCADELERIVDAFGFVKGKDTLYQTGDIINKGPDMIRAMKFIQDNGILTVRGNHEEHLIRMMEVPQTEWTEKQRGRFARLSLEEWTWIRNIVKDWPLWRDTPHALLVHAGLEPGKSKLEDMDPKVLLSVRLWNDIPWFEQVKWHKTVVFGHWAKKGFVNIPGFIGLDSGCVYGKKLTAWCPEEDKFYEIPAAREYSPVKDKTKVALEAPCKVPGDKLPYSQRPKSFEDIKACIKSGDIALADSSEEAEKIRKASPSIAAEWAGY